MYESFAPTDKLQEKKCTADCLVCGGFLHSKIVGSESLLPRDEFSLSFSVDETSADWTVCGTLRGGFLPSPAKNKAKRKNYLLDETLINRVQRLLGASTASEAIEMALNEVITERERNREVWAATERLLKSGIQVEDVFGRLEEGQ